MSDQAEDLIEEEPEDLGAVESAWELGPNKLRLLTALLSATTIRDAAKAAGMSERNAHRYLNNPAFQHALGLARRQSIAKAIVHLQLAASTAVEALQKIAQDEAASETARVAAARGILEFAFRATENEERLSLRRDCTDVIPVRRHIRRRPRALDTGEERTG